MKKRIRNDKGVTILEVVVAVAILVALSIPVGKAIIASSKYQYRARVRENLNMVADSIMENFKAFSIEEMEERFDNGTFSDELYGSSMDSSTELSYTENEDSSIDFNIEKIRIYNDTYDINAKVTRVPGYSNQKITSFDDFDKYSSALAMIPEKKNTMYETARRNFEENFAEDFLNKYKAYEKQNPTANLTIDNIDYSYFKVLKRTINIYLSQNDTDNIGFYNITYEYMMKDYPYFDKETRTKVVNNKTIVEDVFVRKKFDYGVFEFTTSNMSFYSADKDNEKGIERLYVYYYPVYKERSGDSFSEKIVINNNLPGNYKIDLYMLKQKDRDLGSTLDTYEGAYVPNVSTNGDFLHFYHNFNRNLYKNTNINVYGRGQDLSEAIKKEDETILYNIDIEVKKGETVWAKLSSTIRK